MSIREATTASLQEKEILGTNQSTISQEARNVILKSREKKENIHPILEVKSLPENVVILINESFPTNQSSISQEA